MNFTLDEEQLAFQEAARSFAEKEFMPYASLWDAEKVFPKEAISKAASLGFCGLYSSEEVGGLGISRLSSAIVFEELAAACPSTTAYLSIHNMVCWMIDTFAQDKVRETYCPKLTTGQWLGSYCLTEPGAGSDASSLKTSATKQGNSYFLNGTKAFISGAGATDVLIVMARTSNDKSSGITAFVVDAKSPGITYGEKEKKIGWNSQPTRFVFFDQVEVSECNILGAVGDGFKIALKGLDGGRINIGICSVGAAQGALNQVRRYVHEREQFGKSLAQFQSIQFKIADMQTNLVAARQMIYLAASHLDDFNANASIYCAMAKGFATDKSFEICNEALQILGGYGCTQDFPVERLMRDARVHQVVEGTNEIMKLIISRKALDKATSNLEIR